MNSKCVEGNIKFGWSNYAVNKIICDSGIIISLFFTYADFIHCWVEVAF